MEPAPRDKVPEWAVEKEKNKVAAEADVWEEPASARAAIVYA
jgi:hypothetical protein